MRLKTRHPCIGICSTALGDPICRGCHRTAEEVDNWNGYSTEKQTQIIWRISRQKNQPKPVNLIQEEESQMWV